MNALSASRGSAALRGLALLLACAVWLPEPTARACLAEFRSLDWLVADSPLIFIGMVVRVEEAGEQSEEGSRDDRPGPATIVVRVSRILKGQCTDKELQIANGPLRSCAPYDVYARFKTGERLIFLLPAEPAEQKSRIVYGGSVRSVGQLEAVESRIQRWWSIHDEELRLMKAETPEIYRRAEALRQDVTQLAKDWPKPGAGERGRFAAHQERLETRLDGEPLAAVVGAEILERVANRPGWTGHPVWRAKLPSARERGDKKPMGRDAEMAEFCRQRIRTMLTRAGVEKRAIDAYLGYLRDEDLDLTVSFPLESPDAYNRRQGAPSNDVFTTDFILRFHCYDRGGMFRDYGMQFDTLKKLQPQRVAEIIPALWHSNDERTALVGYRAVESMPGVDFVGLVLESQLDDMPHAWRVFAEGPPERLAALVKEAHATKHGWSVGEFWRTLAATECFEEPCLQAALELNESAANKFDARSYEFVRESLDDYLRRAMASRTEAPAAKLPADLKKWFQEHPRKKP